VKYYCYRETVIEARSRQPIFVLLSVRHADAWESYCYLAKTVTLKLCHYTGWLNKNRIFLRYHIFAAITDIIMRFMLNCSEITAENKKRQFF